MNRRLTLAILLTLLSCLLFAATQIVTVHAQSMTNPGTSGLVSWWTLDEAVSSGTRYDSWINHNNLSDTNTVGYTTGKIGNAAQFVAANNEWLSVASNPSLQAGTATSFWAGCWFNQTTDTSGVMFGRATPSGTEWRISRNATNWIALVHLTAADLSVSTSSPAFSAGTWVLVQIWYDFSTSTAYLKFNNGSATSGTNTIAPAPAGNSPFAIGGNGTSGTFDGALDECFYYKNHIPTADEQNWMWNGGTGRTFADLDLPTATPTSSDTPTATFTNTPNATATATYTPTITLTPTNTPTPTPTTFGWIATMPVSGEAYSIVPTATFGDIAISVFLFGLGILSIVQIWLHLNPRNRAKRGRDASTL